MPPMQLDEIIERSKRELAAMSPEARAAMYEAQRQSWLRAMAPCEHGVRDWETCPDCRALSNQSGGER